MLVAQATDERTLRAVAHSQSADIPAETPFAGLVTGGRLVVSVEQGAGAVPWQGVVPLEGQSLGACLESYFETSEQLPTAIVLAADASRATGLLLQKLPDPANQGEAADAAAQDLWEEVGAMLATLGGDELLVTDLQTLLHRLFGAHDLRLFDAEPVQFACRCGQERVVSMLRGLGQQEVESIVAEQGAVVVTCEFCQKPYAFDAVDVAQLFLPQAGEGNTRLN
jgi:molecular chaperone Hsp33